jgi:hypothetical protein
VGWFLPNPLGGPLQLRCGCCFDDTAIRRCAPPLLLLDKQVSALSILIGVAGLLILGVAVRLLMGVMMRAALDSVLAVGVLHQIFDASNNNGGVVDSLLDGAETGNMTQLAAVVLTVLVAAWLLWRRPGAFAKRQAPIPDSPRGVG